MPKICWNEPHLISDCAPTTTLLPAIAELVRIQDALKSSLLCQSQARPCHYVLSAFKARTAWGSLSGGGAAPGKRSGPIGTERLPFSQTPFPWRHRSPCSYNKASRAARGSPIEPAPAKVAELADAPDLGSGGETRGGSSPPFRTNGLARERDDLQSDQSRNSASSVLSVLLNKKSPTKSEGDLIGATASRDDLDYGHRHCQH
jgi:hypothetical protein